MTKMSRGKIGAQFELMRIKHPRIPEVHEALTSAREFGRATRYSPQRYLEMFAPSHSGKTMAIRTYLEDVVVDDAIRMGLFPADMDRGEIYRQQKLVLHVTLSPNATPKSLATDLLRVFGDKRSIGPNKTVLLARVYEFLQTEGVELIVLDEIQHLAHQTAETRNGKQAKSHVIESTDVTDTLKTMLIDGLVPMVFVGIPEARNHLEIDQQLLNRELDKIDFSPLQWSEQRDRDILLEYAGTVGLLIQQHGILPEESDFVSDDIPEMLWAASGGMIGLVSRITEQACFHAVERGGSQVTFDDLSRAVDTRAIPNKFCTYNPFKEGVRAVKVKS